MIDSKTLRSKPAILLGAAVTCLLFGLGWLLIRPTAKKNEMNALPSQRPAVQQTVRPNPEPAPVARPKPEQPRPVSAAKPVTESKADDDWPNAASTPKPKVIRLQTADPSSSPPLAIDDFPLEIAPAPRKASSKKVD